MYSLPDIINIIQNVFACFAHINQYINSLKALRGYSMTAPTFDMIFFNVTEDLSHSVIYHHGA